MRLKLNKTLRAALIAAVSTVGFTLTQAQAADYTIITFAPEGNTSSWADYNIYHSGYPASPAGGATTIITDAALGSSGITYSVRLENGGGKVGTDAAIDVSSWTNSAALAEMNTAMGTSLTTTELAQSYYLYGWQGGRIISQTFNFTGATAETDKVKNGDTITLYVGVTAHDTNLSSFTLTGLSDDTTYTYATDTGSGFGAQAFSSGAKHLTIVKVEGTVEDASAMKFSGSGKNGISFIAYDAVAAAPVTTLTWNGTEDNHVLTGTVWNDGTETPAAYSDASPLVFGTDGYRTVSVVADTTAKSVEVQASGYTIENAANTTLSVKSITVAEGATLALGGTGTTALSGSLSIADAGSLKVAEGATLKVTGANAAKAVLTDTGLDNKGTVEVGADVTIDSSLTSKLGGTLTVASGKKLTLGTTKDSHTIDLTSLDALVLGQGANIDTKALKVDINNLTANGSTLKMLDTKAKDTDGVVLHGTTTLEGDLSITGDWKYKINIEKLAGTGSLQLTGGNEEHRAVIGDVDIHSLTVTNKMNNVDITGTVVLSGVLGVNGTTNVTGGNAMTVGGLTGSAALNVANGITFTAAEGTYSYTGALTVGGKVTKQGAGSQTIGGYAMHDSIDVQAGTLVLNGTYSIDGIETVGDNHYVDASGETSTSGFYYQSGSKTVYTKAEDATLTTTDATFTFNNTAVELTGGKYSVDPTTDKTTVWVNGTDTVDYDTYYEASGETPALTTAKVADGATLVLGEHAVGTLAYQENGTTINLSGTGTIGAISGSGTLNLVEGADATLSGTVTVNSGESFDTTGAGSLTVESLKVNGGTANIASNLTVTGGGDGKGGNNSKGLFLTGSNSTLNINEGTTTVTGAFYTNGGGINVNVGSDDKAATLVARRIELGDNGGGTGSFTIGKMGKVVVTGNEDYRNDTANPQKNTSLQMAEWGQQLTDTVKGKLYAKDATAFMSNDADSTVNINGGTMAVKGIACSNVTANRAHTLSIANGGKLIMGERGLAAEPGSWNFSVAGGEIGMYADTTVVGRDLTLAGDLTFNTAKYTWSGEGAAQELTEGEEGGTLTVSGTISGSGNITKKGAGTLLVDTLAVTGGSLNVTEGDASIGSIVKTGEGDFTMTATGTTKLVYGIDLLEGKLTMSGSYDISDIYVDGEPTYSGGVNDDNGFAVVDGNAQVVTVTEGATLDAAAATFAWGGSTVTLDETGAASVTGTNYGIFYIFTESETVTQAKSQEGEHGPLASIYVAEDATLTVDQDINAGLLHEYSTGTVSINGGKTVNGTMEGVTVAGSGTYALTSGTAALGADTTLDDGWTGVVRISNATKGDGNSAWISALAYGESWVEFVNFTGYDRAWASSFAPEVTANIILTDDAEHHAAWNLSAYASATNTMVLSGDVKGNGTFLTAGGIGSQSQAIEFRGDISGWDGDFVADAPGMRQVVFTGDATQVNAAITKQGAGALNLVVGNGTDAFETEFNAAVIDAAITVKANATATFNELHITQAINNSGTVTLNSDLEVSGFQESAGQNGYFDLNGTFSTTGNGYSGTSDSYLTIVDGGTVQGSITVTQDETAYTLENSGLALKGDKAVNYGTFYVNTDTVDISAIKDDGHASKVEVYGGTLDVDQATDLVITVTNEGTLTGEKLDVTQVGINQYATAMFEQGIQDGHVKISSEGEAVEVLNWEEATTKYSLSNSAMVVTAGSIEKISVGDDVTVSNYLNVDDIVNIQGGALTLNGQEDAMTVKNLTIGQNSTVEILDYESGQEATVTVTEELAAGNGTLLANLVMADDSALLLEGVQKGVSIGSALTMNTGIMLDEATLSALDGMAIGETFWLIGAAQGTTMEYTGQSGEDAWYDSVFSRTAAEGSNYKLQGDFNIAFSETDGFGLTKFSNTPEPTTGTLSLLALAALAARRRRK